MTSVIPPPEDDSEQEIYDQRDYDALVSSNPSMLCIVPEEYQTAEMALYVAMHDPSMAKYIKNEELAQQIYYQVIVTQASCSFLEHVPKHRLTRDLFWKILQYTIEAIRYFTQWEKYMTQEEIIALLNQHPDAILFMKDVPEQYWKYVMTELLERLKPSTIQTCPKEIATVLSDEHAKYILKNVSPFNTNEKRKRISENLLSPLWMALFRRLYPQSPGSYCECCSLIENKFVLERDRWCTCSR